jgi:dihydroorotate dehydrogenase
MATKQLSHSHWCGYGPSAGIVYEPSSFICSTVLAASSKSTGCGSTGRSSSGCSSMISSITYGITLLLADEMLVAMLGVIMELRPYVETLEGEHLKTAAEFALHSLARYRFGRHVLELAQGGERIEDSRLNTTVSGMQFENPLMVGAGWDKKGWAVDGLYTLGFAGTEVGSVLVHPQKGNARPRLWYKEGVGLNRLGFNSKGMEAVAGHLETQKTPGIVGISLGKNKLTPDEHAAWAHAAVAQRLYEYGDYFVVNVASPNTPGLRGLLKPGPLREMVQAVCAVTGSKPLFIKTTVDLALEDLDEVLDVCVSEGVGVIDSNTTVDNEIKSRYGWQDEMGGVSGADPSLRQEATARMRHITKITRGTGISRIGVGSINDTESALERIRAGAQVVQVVTGIRQRKGRIAHSINRGILDRMSKDGVSNIEEYVGLDT